MIAGMNTKGKYSQNIYFLAEMPQSYIQKMGVTEYKLYTTGGLMMILDFIRFTVTKNRL